MGKQYGPRRRCQGNRGGVCLLPGLHAPGVDYEFRAVSVRLPNAGSRITRLWNQRRATGYRLHREDGRIQMEGAEKKGEEGEYPKNNLKTRTVISRPFSMRNVDQPRQGADLWRGRYFCRFVKNVCRREKKESWGGCAWLFFLQRITPWTFPQSVCYQLFNVIPHIATLSLREIER